jgi:hypothetical protein
MSRATVGAVGRLLQGVVSPVHEGVAPVGVLDVALGRLGLVAVNIADDPPHVVDVLVGVVGLVLSEYLYDLAARFVALGLAPAVLLAYLLGIFAFEPLLELLAAHVDRLVELLHDLLVALGHLSS